LIEIIKSQKDSAIYHFHVIGGGSLASLLTAELGGFTHVSIREPLFNLASFLASFDFLLMPSRHEGLSILALEANFNGLPAIINACPGLHETLPNDWPLRVEHNDLNTYLHLFNDVLPVINRHELQTIARQFAEKHFSMRSMREGYERLYAQAFKA
ncbi:MAG: glycosyltransferase, partial [Prevotella salivae]|nr:glycosyltransferase [Segatella salivae]